MQLKFTYLAAAVVLATSAFAAADVQSNESIVVRSSAGLRAAHGAAAPDPVARAFGASFDTKAAAAVTRADKQFQSDLAKFTELNGKDHVTKDEASDALSSFNDHLSQLGSAFQKLAAESKGIQTRSLEERKDILAPTSRLLVRHLITNLGVAPVSEIIKQITPGLKKLNLGLEAVVHTYGKVVGPTIFDPILKGYYLVLKAYGLELNGRDALVERAGGDLSASATHEVSALLSHAGDNFALDAKHFQALLDQDKITLPEFKQAMEQFNGHMTSASAALSKIHHPLVKEGDLDRRAPTGELTLATNKFVKDMSIVTPLLYRLLRRGLSSLELNSVNQILTALEPTAHNLYHELENFVRGLGGVYAPLVNPTLAYITAWSNGISNALKHLPIH
ncbi:unnamed protein product [Tilletia laevis]|uniref:Uncharacterized protein n=1 Tax=Tilletia laevis TaxID=157183 RepID=A0A9N8QI83_9BASI|nr:hypothetical protein CF335_g4443 [Tilletia laevis]CAD6926653.1 unnamed protein product [Tilletia controversa]CAD6930058.1 unnamed protein product [Tilletia caries]CAD6950633.1 unnamed protein product [Tilletia laevis]